MTRLANDRWGKSRVRVSKIHRGPDGDDFNDVTVQVMLEGDVEAAHTEGDNSHVLPTDTMRNTVYVLAQDHLGSDLEQFASVLVNRFLEPAFIDRATVRISQQRWERVGPRGFVGGSTECRIARVEATRSSRVAYAGVEGLVVLKTGGSAFVGFPRDEYTLLPEAEDRILATSVTADWKYGRLPDDTTSTWESVRGLLLERFFGDWSASVQHQGWLMAQAVLDSIPEIDELSFNLPNQHHLPFDLTRLGSEDHGIVFHPVSEPFGDISLTVTR